jgi:hypothetical protein
MLKFTYKGSFWTIKMAYKKNCIENPNGEHKLWCLIYVWNFLFLKNIKISIFGGISKFLELIIFGQILAILGRFELIMLHWWWLRECPKQG